MPETVKDIARKAEVSHMVGIVTCCVAAPCYGEVQDRLQNVAHSLIIRYLFFISAQINELKKYVSAIALHYDVKASFLDILNPDIAASP